LPSLDVAQPKDTFPAQDCTHRLESTYFFRAKISEGDVCSKHQDMSRYFAPNDTAKECISKSDGTRCHLFLALDQAMVDYDDAFEVGDAARMNACMTAIRAIAEAIDEITKKHAGRPRLLALS
jgi:hypothetical protein